MLRRFFLGFGPLKSAPNINIFLFLAKISESLAHDVFFRIFPVRLALDFRFFRRMGPGPSRQFGGLFGFASGEMPEKLHVLRHDRRLQPSRINAGAQEYSVGHRKNVSALFLSRFFAFKRHTLIYAEKDVGLSIYVLNLVLLTLKKN